MEKRKLFLTFISLSLLFSLTRTGETRSFGNFLGERIKTLDQKIVESQQPSKPPEPPPEQNRPPYVPCSPNPSDGATNVGTSSVTLSWQGGDPDGDMVTYTIKVYNNKEEFSSFSSSAPSVTIPSLEQGATYTWQIVATDTKGSTTIGPTWTFVTQAPPPQKEEWEVLQETENYSLLRKCEFKNVGEGGWGEKLWIITETLGVRKKGNKEVSCIGSSTINTLYPSLTAPLLTGVNTCLVEAENNLHLIWYKQSNSGWYRIYTTSSNEGKSWKNPPIYIQDYNAYPGALGGIIQSLFLQTPNVIQYIWNCCNNPGGGVYIYSSWDAGVSWSSQNVCNYLEYDSGSLETMIYGRKIHSILWNENGWIEIKVEIIADGPNFFYYTSNDYGHTWSLERKDE